MPVSIDPWILGPLRAFEVAGRLQSFTRAAEVLHLTQSAISQQIRQLEDRLGFPLFIRHSRGLHLTPQGGELLTAVQRSFTEITSTVTRLRRHDAAALEVNCLPSLALHWLVPRLATWYGQHAGYPVRITADLKALDLRATEHEATDLGIRYEPAAQSQPGTTVFMDEYLLPVATPEYLEAHPALQNADVGIDVVFLHDAAPWHNAPAYAEWQQWMQAHRPAWIPSLAGPQFNLASMMLSAALNHQGVALGRTAIVYDDLKAGRLVDVTRTYLRAPADYLLIVPNGQEERSAAFRQWLHAEAAAFNISRRALLPGLPAPR